jgi:hypothetical protein
MDQIIKPQSALASLQAGSNVGEARLVYLYAGAGASVITVSGIVNGSFTIPNGETRIVEKEPGDLITATVAVEATHIAYK